MTHPVFDHIAIIYNPISTGDAPRLAEELHRDIIKAYPKAAEYALLTPTEHAGHALELAEGISKTHKRPLIISVSGDGGYNEVLNGAMNAKISSKKAKPVIAVVGAGNANDHRRVVRKDDTPLIKLIQKGNAKPLDILQMDVTAKNYTLSRYAHSYIGFGITPKVAIELNKHELNFFQEVKIVVRSFLKYKPFTVEYKEITRRVDSLIFANINEMAKVIKLSQERNLHDNQFEVIEIPHRNKFSLLFVMIKAAIVGLKDQPQHEAYTFKTAAPHPIQLDGEVEQLPTHATVTIKSIGDAIESLY